MLVDSDDRNLEGFLAECVHESLANYQLPNAVFLSERLYAAVPSEANAHLLATCYYRSDQAYRAYHVLRGRPAPQCRYLFALCCYRLEKLPEAEGALGSVPGNDNAAGAIKGTSSGAADVPNGAAGLHLLGMICKDTGRRSAAVTHFTAALTADPFLWSAYEELCALGADAEAQAVMHRARPDRMYPPIAALKIDAVGFDEGGAHAHDGAHDGGGGGGWGGDAGGGGFRHGGGQTETGRVVGDGTHPGSVMATPTMGTPSAGLRAPATMPTGPGFGLFGSSTGGRRGGPRGDLRDVDNTPACGAAEGRTDEDLETVVEGSMLTSSIPDSATQEGGAGDFVTPSPAPSAKVPPPLARANQLVPRSVGGDTVGPEGGGFDGGGSTAGAERGGGGRGVRGERRKFVDEGKLRKVSGGLFSEAPGSSAGAVHPRRSSRLATGGTPSTSNAGFATPSEAGGLTPPRRSRGGRGRGGGGQSAEDTHGHRPFGNLGGAASAGPIGGSRLVAASGRSAEGAAAALSLLRPLADAVRLLAMFQCQEAIDAARRLPRSQYATGYVLCLVGRAHAEMVNYPEAERAFAWARSVCPHRLEGMEVYSTVLWHLKKEVQLSHLSQECVALDRLSPSTWCVLGNCFSLQKEHETALRYFQRALQLDPRCTYAHTLCGHEYFANEDFEKAMACYRAALRLDSRHYNAWYGLGTVYYRQEKYELSEYHFRHALGINNRSSVLFCYLGMAQHALKRSEGALELLQHAIALDSRNPLAKYEKASVLLSDDRFQEALEELEALKQVAPREASVFFLMGRIYKKLGLPDQAMVHFSIALDLKPASSDVNLIKSAIEKLHVPDDSEDDDL